MAENLCIMSFKGVLFFKVLVTKYILVHRSSTKMSKVCTVFVLQSFFSHSFLCSTLRYFESFNKSKLCSCST